MYQCVFVIFQRTFGWSLSAGMDLDNNNYPDLLVGAYESNNAVFLKSAPVVHLDSEVQLLVPGKQINLGNKNCAIRDGTRVPCVDLEVTLEYDGVGVPDTINLEVQYVLDAKKQKELRRLFFVDYERETERNETITVTRGKKERKRMKVHLPASGIQDKLTSIDVQVRYSLAKPNRNYYGRQRRELAPVLGHYDQMATDSVSIQKNCGPDNKCVPNLVIDVSHADAYVWGSEEKLEITADIYNAGEDAFNTFLYLSLPKEIEYSSANSSASSILDCSRPLPSNNRTLKCDIGNPLPSRTTVSTGTIYVLCIVVIHSQITIMFCRPLLEFSYNQPRHLLQMKKITLENMPSTWLLPVQIQRIQAMRLTMRNSFIFH